MKRLPLFLAAGVLLAAVTFWTAACMAQDSFRAQGPQLTEAEKAYFVSVRDAIEKGDKEWLAGQILIPFGTFIGGQRQDLNSKELFLAHYDEIVNDYVRDQVRKQDPDQLFKNWQGVMVGDGSVWFDSNSDGSGFNIVTINNIPPGPATIAKEPKGGL